MYSKRTWSDYRGFVRRKRLMVAAAVVLVAALVAAGSVSLAGKLRGRTRVTRRELMQYWDAGSFGQVYSQSQAALATRPMDYFLLTMHGFAAYQLGVSQINSLDASQYFEDCVWSLRKAMLLRNSAGDGRLYYVLGKAYSYKGDSFADLSVKYLERARDLSFVGADIPQYLGMSYAVIGNYRSSVAAYSEALGAEEALGPSSLLLLSIARSYLALDEFEMARAYLQRCVEVSRDSRTILSARLLLAEALRKAGDNAGAAQQLQAILDEVGDNAEAHFQLGELYALQGDTSRARAAWRLALRADPAHIMARTRLSI